MTHSLTTKTPSRPGYRLWFLLDGLVTGANAIAYLALHKVIPDVLGSTPELYLAAGSILAVVTVALLAVAWSRSPLGALPGLLIAVNITWAAGSFVVALVDPFALSLIGRIWAVAQGAIVMLFALLQRGVAR